MKGKNISRISALIIISCAFVWTARAQWKAVCNKKVVSDTLYSIWKDHGFAIAPGFHFPEYSYYNEIHALAGGIDRSQSWNQASSGSESDSFARETEIFKKVFPEKITIRTDTTVIFSRIYTRNIQAYNLYFYDGTVKRWKKRNVRLSFEGFQIPLTEPLGEWSLLDSSPLASGKDPAYATDVLYITVIPTDTKQDFQFIIGTLDIVNQNKLIIPVTHPFFSFLKDVREPDVSSSSSGYASHASWSSYFEKVPTQLSEISLPPRIEIVSESGVRNDSIDRVLLKNLLTACLGNYPFYNERRLNKARVKKEMDGIFDKARNLPYCALVDSLSSYILVKFDDLHFYIERPEQGDCAVLYTSKAKGPIRVVAIHDKYYVAANFDPAYSAIRINDELISIDGIPVEKVSDSMAKYYYGPTLLTPFKKSNIIASLLDRYSKDSCTVQIRHNESHEIRSYTIKYDKKYSIPDNFRPIQCEFRKYDSISYYKINYWEEPVYLRFINHWEDISRSSGIILDLRGNGGGELMTAMQLFAIFSATPTTYFNFITPGGGLEPVTILPDTVYNIPVRKKIVIIGDQGTACSSEAFIQAMRQKENVYFISSTNTVGSLAAKYDIRLPTGVVIHTDAIQQKICYKTGKDVIEASGGLIPDKMISIDKAEDLRPYNDKLLKEAIKILSADKRD